VNVAHEDGTGRYLAEGKVYSGDLHQVYAFKVEERKSHSLQIDFRSFRINTAGCVLLAQGENANRQDG